MEKFGLVKSGGSAMVDWVTNSETDVIDENHEHAGVGAGNALTCTYDAAKLEQVLLTACSSFC